MRRALAYGLYSYPSVRVIEVEARERADQETGKLQQHLVESDEVQKVLAGRLQELQGRLVDVVDRGGQCEMVETRTASDLKRAKANLTDVVSQISSDVNAISFHLASGGSLGNDRVHDIAKS